MSTAARHFGHEIVPIVEHQDVVEAFATQGTEKAFADSVHVRRAHRRAVIRMPVARASASKAVPNLSSRSRIKNRGAAPKGVALRSCCVTHACGGKRVVAACMTLRVANSMNTNAKIGRKNTS